MPRQYSVDRAIQEGRLVLAAARRHSEALERLGIDEDLLRRLESAVEGSKKLQLTQVGAVEELRQMTAVQEKAHTAAADWAATMRATGRLSFLKDEAIRKEFRVGRKLPTSVSGLLREGRLILAAARKYLDPEKARLIQEK